MADTYEKMLYITNHQGTQIKTTMSYHLIPVRMVVIKTGVGEDVERKKKKKKDSHPCALLVGM